MQIVQNRRRFVAGLSATGIASLFNVRASHGAGEAPPETTKVRLPQVFPASCDAANYIAAELLRAEGFTDVRYVEGESGVDSTIWIAQGNLDFDVNYGPTHIISIDAGVPITVLAGLHTGCLELIANESVQSIADLKGKRVGVYALSSNPHILVTLMAAYVGLDPKKDIEWVIDPKKTSMELFVEGKIDAFLSPPPEPQELRARKIGHTILKTTYDDPWSQYYCCMVAGASDYVNSYPIATKRVLRAMLKAVDLCLTDPQGVVQQLVDRKLATAYDFTVEALKELPYGRWREFDPEDSIRFYALRMQEVGLIKRSPNKIITESTNWSFLNELKRELKM